MDLREWLLIIGVIIIAGILLDGYRRMRLARKDSLTMSKEMGAGFENTPIDDDFNPELPNGGARIVGSDDPIEPELQEREEPTIGEAIPQEEVLDDTPIIADADARVSVKGPIVGHAGKLKAEPKTPEPPSGKMPKQEVLVINVESRSPSGFSGQMLRELLEACGLNHGDMNIFHRHEEDDLLSPIQFSVANAIEPGYFDLATMDNSATPCVSFFMSIPGPKDYMKAFDYMLETAKALGKNLDGEIKDEQHSIMTVQTIEHCRQRIKEFERKQLSQVK